MENSVIWPDPVFLYETAETDALLHFDIDYVLDMTYLSRSIQTMEFEDKFTLQLLHLLIYFLLVIFISKSIWPLS